MSLAPEEELSALGPEAKLSSAYSSRLTTPNPTSTGPRSNRGVDRPSAWKTVDGSPLVPGSLVLLPLLLDVSVGAWSVGSAAGAGASAAPPAAGLTTVFSAACSPAEAAEAEAAAEVALAST